LVALLLGSIGWALLATTFMVYDDEGYVLTSLRDVAAGAPLYTEVFSQYGPFPYALYRVLGALGYPFTSDSARVVALVCWLGAAGGAGVIARRFAGAAAGLVSAVLAFIVLTAMRSEPGHPGGMLALLTAVGAGLGLRRIEVGRWRAFAFVQSLLGSAMLLSKVNVGVFHLIGAAAAWPFRAPRALGMKLRHLILATGVVLGGGLLMQSLIRERPAQVFLFLFCAAAMPLAMLAPEPDRDESPRASLGLVAIGGGGLAAITIVTTLMGGTRIADLIAQAFIAPLRHPGVYHHFITWRPFALAVSAISLAAFALYRLGPLACRRPVLITGKIGAAFALAWGLQRAEFGGLETTLFQFVVPLGWTLATPLEPTAPGRTRARWWLAWLMCWHWLQAYPIAGSQIGWGTFLCVPLLVVGLYDLTTLRPRLRLSITLILALAAAGALGKIGYYAVSFWRDSVPLDLPGARWVRPDPATSSTLQILVANVRANTHTLFTYPGMLSVNQWAELPPPTHANVTHWFSLLSVEQQEAVRRRLATDKTSLILVQREHVLFLIGKGLGPSGPLKDYIHREFRPIIRLESFDLWARPGQTFTPIALARTVTRNNTTVLRLFTTQAARDVVRIEFHDLGTGAALPTLLRTPEWTSMRWTGLVSRLEVPLRESPLPSSLTRMEIRLVDAAGRVIDRLRFDAAPVPEAAFTAAAPPGSG
jgi:hypothetical protein